MLVWETTLSVRNINAIRAFEANYQSYFILGFYNLIYKSRAITAMMKYSFILIMPKWCH
jgi:hypothetical protein